MPKSHECMFLIAFLTLCWMGMQAVHELGHVLATLAIGGTVERVVLHPLTISRTEVAPNPHPALVAWAGPGLGSVFPLLLVAAMMGRNELLKALLLFFSGFCLIANGVYIAFGSLGGIGDAKELLRHGSPPWSLWVFGLIVTSAGLILWHHLGPWLGWQTVRQEITPRMTAIMVVVTIAWIGLSCLLSG